MSRLEGVPGLEYEVAWFSGAVAPWVELWGVQEGGSWITTPKGVLSLGLGEKLWTCGREPHSFPGRAVGSTLRCDFPSGVSGMSVTPQTISPNFCMCAWQLPVPKWDTEAQGTVRTELAFTWRNSLGLSGKVRDVLHSSPRWAWAGLHGPDVYRNKHSGTAPKSKSQKQPKYLLMWEYE